MLKLNITELFVPTNALRQFFFHCFLYYKDTPIRISAVILPSSGGILSEFLKPPVDGRITAEIRIGAS
jgi:hypothetical protein